MKQRLYREVFRAICDFGAKQRHACKFNLGRKKARGVRRRTARMRSLNDGLDGHTGYRSRRVTFHEVDEQQDVPIALDSARSNDRPAALAYYGSLKSTMIQHKTNPSYSNTQLGSLTIYKTTSGHKDSRLGLLRRALLGASRTPSSPTGREDPDAIPSAHLYRCAPTNRDDTVHERISVESRREEGERAHRSGSFSLRQSPSALRVFLIHRFRPD